MFMADASDSELLSATDTRSFELFYRRLSDRGFIIYPGKLTQVNTFRIGTIGRLFEGDIRGLLAAIKETLDEMGVKTLAH